MQTATATIEDQFSRTRRRSTGLRATFLVFTLVISLVGWVSVSAVRDQVEKSVASRLQENLAASTSSLESWLHSQETNVATWAADPAIVRAASYRLQVVGEEGPESFALDDPFGLKRLRTRLGPVCRQHGYGDFLIVSPGGLQVASLFDEQIGKRTVYDDDDFLQRILRSGPAVSRPIAAVKSGRRQKSSLENDYWLRIGAPIHDEQGNAIAALLFHIRPQREFRRVLSNTFVAEHSELYLFDEQGRLLSEVGDIGRLRAIGVLDDPQKDSAVLNVELRDPGRILTPHNRRPQNSKRFPLTKPVAAAAQNTAGYDTHGYRDFRGVEVVGAWRWLPEYGIGVVVEIESRQAYSLFYSLRASIVAAGVLLVLVTLVAVGLRRWYERYIDMLVMIKESRAAFSAIVESSEDAILGAGLDGRIKSWNTSAERLFGYSASEIIGQPISILARAPGTRDAEQALAAAKRGDSTDPLEILRRTKDGKLVEVSLKVSPIKDNSGKVIGVSEIIRDISDQKKRERELQEYMVSLEDARRKLQEQANDLWRQSYDLRRANAAANRANVAKGEFLANMSHELRTPLTAILGFNDLLRENVTQPQYVEAAETIQRNGEYLLRLINDILDFSKIESGKLDIETIAFSTDAFLADVIALMRLRAEEKKLEISLEYDGPIPKTMQTDPTRLRQILVNLLSNAIKFTETGAVRLVARFVDRRPTARLEFDVVDTGIGMTNDQIEKLFQPFTQADSSVTRKFGGTGLGLAISMRLAELLGGAISVDSMPGKGSRFRLAIDAGAADGLEMTHTPRTGLKSPGSRAAIADKSALKHCRVLLAEDGQDNQRLISWVLKNAGAEVQVVANGRLAVRAAISARQNHKPFDCILMDMQMPIMDGYTATAELRKANYTGSIVALTAHAMADDRQKCLSAGCDDFVTKPINIPNLIALVASYSETMSPAETDPAEISV